MLKNQETTDVSLLKDFEHEVDIMENLRSQYIVHFVGACHLLGKLAIVTVISLLSSFQLLLQEFLSLGSLRTCLRTYKFSLPFKSTKVK